MGAGSSAYSMKVNVEIAKNKEIILSFSVETSAYDISDVRQKIAGAIVAQIKQLSH
jgi:hypothetical protein